MNLGLSLLKIPNEIPGRTDGTEHLDDRTNTDTEYVVTRLA